MKGFIALAVAGVLVFGGVVKADNYALQFDGANDYTAVPNSSGLSPQVQYGQMTISTWFRLDAAAGGQAVTKGSSWTALEYSIGISTAGVGFGLWDAGGTDYATTHGGSVGLGEWHNVTGTYMKGSYIKVYLDGALVGQTTGLSNYPPLTAGSGSLCFGKEDHLSHPWNFPGALDDVELWNYAKSDAQVAATYNSAITGTETGLLGYWNFNEGTGQILNDLSGHGHNGTLGTGSGVDSSDPTWIQSPVPEPCTVVLLGLGGLALVKRGPKRG